MEVRDEEKKRVECFHNNNLYICIGRRKAVKEVIATHIMATSSQMHEGALGRQSEDII